MAELFCNGGAMRVGTSTTTCPRTLSSEPSAPPPTTGSIPCGTSSCAATDRVRRQVDRGRAL